MGNTVIVIALLLGFITCFIAGCLALSEKDAKKIVALRTLSQLGFIFISLGLSCPGLAFFHLLTHAFFKRCIFIQVGTLIIRSSSMQDGRGYRSPSSFIGGVVLGGCALRLCGFRFSSGFVRKDAILSASFEVFGRISDPNWSRSRWPFWRLFCRVFYPWNWRRLLPVDPSCPNSTRAWSTDVS